MVLVQNGIVIKNRVFLLKHVINLWGTTICIELMRRNDLYFYLQSTQCKWTPRSTQGMTWHHGSPTLCYLQQMQTQLLSLCNNLKEWHPTIARADRNFWLSDVLLYYTKNWYRTLNNGTDFKLQHILQQYIFLSCYNLLQWLNGY